eukprot:5837569-Karenia_brevis.AAC.1
MPLTYCPKTGRLSSATQLEIVPSSHRQFQAAQSVGSRSGPRTRNSGEAVLGPTGKKSRDVSGEPSAKRKRTTKRSSVCREPGFLRQQCTVSALTGARYRAAQKEFEDASGIRLASISDTRLDSLDEHLERHVEKHFNLGHERHFAVYLVAAVAHFFSISLRNCQLWKKTRASLK